MNGKINISIILRTLKYTFFKKIICYITHDTEVYYP